ncbi:uncharacterized protein ARMOST_04147 [Armillaria ostoyae]|uniref:Uncharacterized protein n=1 Tax=Armillaria ostoyae TaxID=47428 RepID=A0A284QWJ6_ARMOS|nr:uncharacterized protein ARMOST_04147 [Armillaria ostoyae]
MSQAMKNTGGSPKKKHGKPTWAVGSCQPFLESQEEDWKTYAKAWKAGDFYELMAKLYIIKYDGIPSSSDLADVNPNLPTDEEVAAWDAAQKEEEKLLMPEELEEKQVEARKTLLYWKSRMGSWYNWHYNGVQKQDQSQMGAIFDAAIEQAKKPRRAQHIHVYSDIFYDSVIKPEIQRELDLKQWKGTRFELMKTVTRRCWGRETEAVKRLVADRVEQNRRRDLMCSIRSALTQGGNYVQVIADTLKDRFRLHASILLVGPIGERGGVIEVRSVHSGTTATGLTWPKSDPQGFLAVEKSLIKFGLKAFSSAECSSRALKGTGNTLDQNAGTINDNDTDTEMLALTPQEPVNDILPKGSVSTSTSPTLTSKDAESPRPGPSMVVGDSMATGSSSSFIASPTAQTPPIAGKKNAEPSTPSANPLTAKPLASQDGEPTGIDPSGYSGPLVTKPSTSQDGKSSSSAGIDSPGHNGPLATKPSTSQDGESPSSASVNPPHSTGHPATPNTPLNTAGLNFGADLTDGDNKDSEMIPMSEEACADLWISVDRGGWYSELSKAFNALCRGRAWDLLWTRATDSLIVFERRCGFQEKGKGLPAKLRPPFIHQFMKEHRWWDKQRDVGDLKELNKAWWAWWGSFQPAERSQGSFAFKKSQNVNWSGLERCHGGTGFMLVMGSLLWWGEAIHKDEERGEDWWNWRMALEEFTWALKHIIRTATPNETHVPKKRKRSQIAEEDHDTDAASGSSKKVSLISSCMPL